MHVCVCIYIYMYRYIVNVLKLLEHSVIKMPYNARLFLVGPVMLWLRSKGLVYTEGVLRLMDKILHYPL